MYKICRRFPNPKILSIETDLGPATSPLYSVLDSYYGRIVPPMDLNEGLEMLASKFRHLHLDLY
jgi:hypothetical protein